MNYLDTVLNTTILGNTKKTYNMSYTFIYVYGANLTGLGNLCRQMMKQLIPHCIITKSGIVANSLTRLCQGF